jgi:hypothetical protein
MNTVVKLALTKTAPFPDELKPILGFSNDDNYWPGTTCVIYNFTSDQWNDVPTVLRLKLDEWMEQQLANNDDIDLEFQFVSLLPGDRYLISTGNPALGIKVQFIN